MRVPRIPSKPLRTSPLTLAPPVGRGESRQEGTEWWKSNAIFCKDLSPLEPGASDHSLKALSPQHWGFIPALHLRRYSSP